MLKEFRSIDVYWDKATRQIYEEIRASSSDEKGRKLTVQIVNDGQIQDLTNVSLNLYWETQDGENRGLDPFEPLDPENGIYELYFRTGMLQHVGKLNAHLHLVDTTGAITSEPFTIVVFSGVDVDAMASDDELSALNKALVEVQTIKQDFVNESNQLIATEKAELDALQLDYANRAETLETTYAPRLNAVEQNIDAQPEIITGSGGVAIKFPSGFMICAGRKDYSYVEVAVDEVVSFEIAFPHPFVADPISITDGSRVIDSMRARGYTGNILSFSSTGFTYDIALDADTPRSGGSIYYTAIGFWK